MTHDRKCFVCGTPHGSKDASGNDIKFHAYLIGTKAYVKCDVCETTEIKARKYEPYQNRNR